VQRELDQAFVYDTASDPGETHDVAGERPVTLRYLHAALGLSLAGSNLPSGARAYVAKKTEIDPATEQQLRALGYVGSARH
jgi:hypothetical protein